MEYILLLLLKIIFHQMFPLDKELVHLIVLYNKNQADTLFAPGNLVGNNTLFRKIYS